LLIKSFSKLLDFIHLCFLEFPGKFRFPEEYKQAGETYERTYTKGTEKSPGFPRKVNKDEMMNKAEEFPKVSVSCLPVKPRMFQN